MESSEYKTSVKELQDLARTRGWTNKFPICENERFLQVLLEVNKMNLKKSTEALKEIISWRGKLALDSLELEDFDDQFEYDTGFFTHGMTHAGAPCLYIHGRLSRFARAMKKFGHEKYLQFVAAKLVQVENEVFTPNGRTFSTSRVVPLICDGSGFTFSTMPSLRDVWAILHACRELYSHFPLFGSTVCIFINVGKWQEWSLRVAKPFLEATGFKVVIHGTNEDKWTDYIDDLLGMDQLRRFQSKAEEYDRKCEEF